MGDQPAREVVAAIDGVLRAYVDNPYLVVPDASTGFRLQFNAVESLTRARKAKRQCMWPDCTSTAITGSHTIPRAAALRQVARRGHLITPAFSQTRGRIVARRIGINDASVIPGFCTAHEAAFAEFETGGHIDTERSLARQLFRSVCREIVQLEVGVAHGERMLEEYQEFCRSQIERLVRERSGNRTASVTSVSPNVLWRDAEERLAGAKKALELLRGLYTQAAAGLANPDDAGLEVVALQLDVVIPVCLSGTGSFQIEQSGSTQHVQAILAVIPGKTSTLISIATTGERREHLSIYRRSTMHGGFPLIGAIESWMVHGTDHWFLSPQVWDEVAVPHRQRILDDIQDPEPGIATPYGSTIFNRLKRDWIRTLETDATVPLEERQRIRATIAPFTDRLAG